MKKLKLKNQNNNRIDEYYYLKFHRPNELITRVDRYSIRVYWDSYSDNKITRKEEQLFYPSRYGMDEIENYKDGFSTHDDNTREFLIHRLEQLKQYGNPYWKKDYEKELTYNVWLSEQNNNIQSKRLKLRSK